MEPTPLLPTSDASLLQDLEVPEFNAEQIAFLKAILTATQKERLGLPLDPELKPQYLMAHASLVGKEEQVAWILASAEAINLSILENGYSPLAEKNHLPITDKELSVLEQEF